MTKFQKQMFRFVALVLVAALMLPMVACRKQEQPGEQQQEPQNTAPATYTVQVKSAGGIPLSAVGVYIYEDKTLAELVWFDQTDDSGCMTFTDVQRDTYVAVLSDLPAGYAVEDVYPLTGLTTEIVLQAATLDEDIISQVTYKLGDMMMDFTVTDSDGTEYTLSQLLAEKDAVVLNFWYVECGPCKAEFPYLQEAYDQYSDRIALLAMNPINAQEDIDAFRSENGYTFPMLSCDNQWEKLMGITAYPTTVVVDRFGNICLIHRGSIDSTKVFTDTFAFFTAEDYQQTLVEDIMDLETEAEEGSADNPNEVGGQSTFEIVVKPGQEVYTDLYKATGMYMSIKGENSQFYVLYNDKTYTPDSSGVVGFVISTGDNFTAAKFAIGNKASETQTFKVALSHLPGTFNNPYSLKLGEFTAKVNAGNSQGVYYRCTAPEDGTYTVQCISAPAGIQYDFSLQCMDVNRTVLRNYHGDGSIDPEKGYPTITMQMKKGTGLMFSVGTLPDDSNSYPAGTFIFLLSFEAGEVEDATKVEKMDYTVTVTDELEQPMAEVTVWLTKDGETVSGKTDENGVLTLNLEKGTYSGTLSIPEGYVLEENAFELTEEAPTASVVLTCVENTLVDYTVTVTDPMGQPVEGAEALVVGGGSGLTDAEGVAIIKLQPGTYTVMIGALPAGYMCSETLTMDEETLSCSFILDYGPGTEYNPIMLLELDNTVTNAGTVYYGTFHNGSTMKITGPAGFTVLRDGEELPSVDGVFSCPIVSFNPRMPVVFAIVGDGEYQITYTYPAGHQMNPAQLVMGQNTASQAAGAMDYYYNWTAPGNGELTITMDADAQWLYCLSNVTSGISGDIHWSDDDPVQLTQTIAVSEGDVIQLTVNTYDPADMWSNPAGDVNVWAAFLWTIGEAPFVTADLEAGSSNTYKVDGIANTTLTIEDADAYVIYGDTTYTADENGVVSLVIGSEDPATLVIGNGGAEKENYEVNFTWPVGSLRNPDTSIPAMFPRTITTRLAEGDTDGYYYAFTITQTGTLTMTRRSSTPAGAGYSITLIRNNGEEIAVPDETDTSKTVKLYVVPDDTILLHVQATAAEDGTYPAVNVVTRATFAVDFTVYTVTFDPNGGILEGETAIQTSNGKLKELAAAPVREGWEFVGWFDAAEGGNPITAGMVIKADTTAYAQWNKVEYTVTFDTNGGYLYVEDTATTTDFMLTELPTPEREGYVFEGWFDLPVGGNAITTEQVYTDHTTIYAQWSSDGTMPDDGRLMTYQVKVVDGDGNPVTGGVYVTWQNAGTTETRAVGSDGTATAELVENGYTVVLTLTGQYKNYRYDTATAITTAAQPALTVRIAEPISDTAVETEYNSGGGTMVTKDLDIGATYVTLNTSQTNYAVIDGTGYCFFRFQITEEGKYSFTTTNGAPISNWGTNTFFIENRTSEEEREANEFVLELKADNFSSEEHVLMLIFAVEVTGNHAGTIVLVEDRGDAEYTYLDAPFAEFEGTETPEVAYEDGKPVAIEENIFKLKTDGKTLTYVDMLTDVAVKGEDGFYHLNTEDGPILYVNMGADAPYISLATMVGAIGQYGTGFKKIFFNEDGTPEVNPDGTYHKEDYTGVLVAYSLHADPTTGVYPLTDDLIYMIQHGGEFKGWYTPGSGAYLFEDSDIEVNPELIWMFAVCYLK